MCLINQVKYYHLYILASLTTIKQSYFIDIFELYNTTLSLLGSPYKPQDCRVSSVLMSLKPLMFLFLISRVYLMSKTKFEVNIQN